MSVVVWTDVGDSVGVLDVVVCVAVIPGDGWLDDCDGVEVCHSVVSIVPGGGDDVGVTAYVDVVVVVPVVSGGEDVLLMSVVCVVVSRVWCESDV